MLIGYKKHVLNAFNRFMKIPVLSSQLGGVLSQPSLRARRYVSAHSWKSNQGSKNSNFMTNQQISPSKSSSIYNASLKNYERVDFRHPSVKQKFKNYIFIHEYKVVLEQNRQSEVRISMIPSKRIHISRQIREMKISNSINWIK